jgi:O-antigen ligase
VIALVISLADVGDRILQTRAADEARIQALPTLWALIKNYAPVGSGIGSFVGVFKVAEPNQMLEGGYMNHAHNDYAELLIEAGLPALLFLLVCGAWLARSAWRVFRYDPKPTQRIMLGRLGVVLCAMIAFASAADYPARTPLIAVVGAMAVAFIQLGTYVRAAPVSQ